MDDLSSLKQIQSVANALEVIYKQKTRERTDGMAKSIDELLTKSSDEPRKNNSGNGFVRNVMRGILGSKDTTFKNVEEVGRKVKLQEEEKSEGEVTRQEGKETRDDD